MSGYTPLKRVELLVVHCAATRANMDVGAKEIDGWHRQRGFRKIGYHFVIRRDGTVETGRALDEPGAHAEQVNSRSLGICLVGGLAKDGKSGADNFAPEQKAALRVLLRELKQKYPAADILGHRDIPGVAKDCPSFNVREWLAANPL